MLLGHFKSVNKEFHFIEMIFFIINTGNWYKQNMYTSKSIRGDIYKTYIQIK